jgi:hypothetical protein
MNRLSVSLAFTAVIIPVADLVAGSGGEDATAVGVGIDLLLMIAGLLCFATCMKVFSLLRGGELSSGWQMLSVSFLLFSLAQALELLVTLELFLMPENAASALHVLSLFLILIGIAKIKKALS